MRVGSGLGPQRWVEAAVLVMDDQGEIVKYRVKDPRGSVEVQVIDLPHSWIMDWRGDPVHPERDVQMTVTLSGLVIPTPPR